MAKPKPIPGDEVTEIITVPAIVWYDRTAIDERVWVVRRGDRTVRALRVDFHGTVATDFKAGGFLDLVGGPRGVIRASDVTTFDEVEIG
jgi:hypothetical protein